jgi:hypothetical protein
MKAPKLTPEAIADLRVNVVTGSRWERYKDGRKVEVWDSGLWRDLVNIRTLIYGIMPQDGTTSTRKTLRVAWVHISRKDLVQQYKQIA